MAGKSESETTASRPSGSPWTEPAVIAAICDLVIGIYVWGAEPGVLEATDSRAGDSCYNLLVQGFRSGHLYVMRDPSPGLAHLAYEMSYYHVLFRFNLQKALTNLLHAHAEEIALQDQFAVEYFGKARGWFS